MSSYSYFDAFKTEVASTSPSETIEVITEVVDAVFDPKLRPLDLKPEFMFRLMNRLSLKDFFEITFGFIVESEISVGVKRKLLAPRKEQSFTVEYREEKVFRKEVWVEYNRVWTASEIYEVSDDGEALYWTLEEEVLNTLPSPPCPPSPSSRSPRHKMRR